MTKRWACAGRGLSLPGGNRSNLEEMQVITALADASSGRSIAGQINLLTRPATSTYHGQLWGMHSGNVAQGFFDNTRDFQRTQSRTSQVGFTAGGVVPKAAGNLYAAFERLFVRGNASPFRRAGY